MLPTDNRGSATYLSHIFTRRAMAYLPCTPYWHKHMRLFMKMKQLMQSSLSLFPMSEETKRCRRCVSVYLDSIQWHHLAFVFAVLVCVRVCVCLYTVRSTTYPVANGMEKIALGAFYAVHAAIEKRHGVAVNERRANGIGSSSGGSS